MKKNEKREDKTKNYSILYEVRQVQSLTSKVGLRQCTTLYNITSVKV